MTPFTVGDNKNWQWLTIKVFYAGGKNYQSVSEAVDIFRNSTSKTLSKPNEPAHMLRVSQPTKTTIDPYPIELAKPQLNVTRIKAVQLPRNEGK